MSKRPAWADSYAGKALALLQSRQGQPDPWVFGVRRKGDPEDEVFLSDVAGDRVGARIGDLEEEPKHEYDKQRGWLIDKQKEKRPGHEKKGRMKYRLIGHTTDPGAQARMKVARFDQKRPVSVSHKEASALLYLVKEARDRLTPEMFAKLDLEGVEARLTQIYKRIY